MLSLVKNVSESHIKNSFSLTGVQPFIFNFWLNRCQSLLKCARNSAGESKNPPQVLQVFLFDAPALLLLAEAVALSSTLSWDARDCPRLSTSFEETAEPTSFTESATLRCIFLFFFLFFFWAFRRSEPEYPKSSSALSDSSWDDIRVCGDVIECVAW